MKTDLKFDVYLLLYQKIEGSLLLNKTINDILTYLPYVDQLYIFNFHKDDQFLLINALKEKNSHIEYAKLQTEGEVIDYIKAMNHAKGKGSDYVTIIKDGYYYEDDCYKDIKRKIILGEIKEDVGIISPLPLYTNEGKEDKKEESRIVKGVHLVGTFIKKDIYFKTEGFISLYYQTTFDYDYCLTIRQMNYQVLVMNNLVLRNRNFKELTKTILWHTYNAYHHDIYDVYYETRNRLYLWQKFKKFDPEYIKIDRKQQSYEFKEMRLFEKKFSFTKEIINQARADYRNGKMGKAFEDIKY